MSAIAVSAASLITDCSTTGTPSSSRLRVTILCCSSSRFFKCRPASVGEKERWGEEEEE